jgi:hypothetical protein
MNDYIVHNYYYIFLHLVTTQIVCVDESPNPQGTIRGQPLGGSPVSPEQPIILCFRLALLRLKGGIPIGLLRPRNESQGDVESSLSKMGVGVFRVF